MQVIYDLFERMNEGPRKKAIIIAISEYNDKQLPSLEFCKNDGEKMYELLRKLGYEISDNHKLVGYAEFDRMRDAIYDFFDNRKTAADDTLLFYYSGHGIPISGDTCLASSEIDYDSPRRLGFSSSDLTNLIQESNSIRIVEILDCCYSGAAKIGKGGAEAAARLGTAAIENNARLLQQGEGKCLLAASQAAQEAFGLREEGHSIFTYYLLQGLKPNERSVDSEGNVTPDSLGTYVYKEIVNLPPERRPRQKPIRKTEASGEIILASYPDLKPIRIEVMLASLSKLLGDGNVEEFNKKRDQLPASLLNFSLINLRGRNLSKVNLSNANMSRADLSNADLDGANLSNTNLFKTNLEGANLHEANLSGADLDEAKLSTANLARADLSDANLSNADLSKTNLFKAYLKQTKVIGTNFIGSNISEATLEGNPLTGAILDQTPPPPVPVPKTMPAKFYIMILAAAVGIVLALAIVFLYPSPPIPSTPGPNPINQSVTTAINSPLSIRLAGTDPTPNANLTATIVAPPRLGTLGKVDQDTGVVVYTPYGNATGLDSFKFKVNDGKQDSKKGTVLITLK